MTHLGVLGGDKEIQIDDGHDEARARDIEEVVPPDGFRVAAALVRRRWWYWCRCG